MIINARAILNVKTKSRAKGGKGTIIMLNIMTSNNGVPNPFFENSLNVLNALST